MGNPWSGCIVYMVAQDISFHTIRSHIYEHGFESDIEGGSLLGRGSSGLPTYEPASQVGPRLRYIENVQCGPPEQR